jgi:hypothetical protein
VCPLVKRMDVASFFMRGNGVVTFVLLSCENSLSLGVFNFVVWQV